MVILALLSLLLGWSLGQFFKVLILVPAVGILIILVSSTSMAAGDTSVQIALKFITVNSMVPVGYALGQTKFYGPRILRWVAKTRHRGWPPCMLDIDSHE